ncbi:hypothetical protein Tco_1449307 [Tanacetum coccineum]
MVKGDDEIKVLGEINIKLESGTHKLIEKLSQEKDSQEEALGEFNSTLENVLQNLSQEKDSPNDFYGFMYDMDDDASIGGKSSEHFGSDSHEKDSPDTEVDWQDDLFHETKVLFVGLDQAIEDVVVQNNVQQEVAREVIFNLLVYKEVVVEVIEMAKDQDEALYDQEMADDSLDHEQVKEKRPSKRIKVTKEYMVKDEKP